jgi:hypothetical protein
MAGGGPAGPEARRQPGGPCSPDQQLGRRSRSTSRRGLDPGALEEEDGGGRLRRLDVARLGGSRLLQSRAWAQVCHNPLDTCGDLFRCLW